METPGFLAEHLGHWLELQRTQLQPSTLRWYTRPANRYLATQPGDRPTEEITHRDPSGFSRTLLISGRPHGKPFALVTVRPVAAMTHKVFEDAVRENPIPSNSCDKALLPPIDPNAQPRRLRVWTTERLASFLEHQKRRCLCVATLGCRRGNRYASGRTPRTALARRGSLARRTVHVRRPLSLLAAASRLKVPRSHRSRSVRIGEAVQEALERQRRVQSQHCDGVPRPPKDESAT